MKNSQNSAKTGSRGNRVTKTTEGTASVAPDTGETTQIGDEIKAGQAPQPGEPGTEPETPAPEEKPAETAKDPFADLEMTTIEDYSFSNLVGQDKVPDSDPRKYANVHKAATDAKLPVKRDWKHLHDMLTIGRIQKEHRPTSVYGTIDSIIRAYGRSGVPAYVVVVELRKRQIGNKRSHYADKGLPPVGWAEGWIDTFVKKNHGAVMAKKAPPISAELVAVVNEGEAQLAAEVESQQREAA